MYHRLGSSSWLVFSGIPLVLSVACTGTSSEGNPPSVGAGTAGSGSGSGSATSSGGAGGSGAASSGASGAGGTSGGAVSGGAGSGGAGSSGGAAGSVTDAAVRDSGASDAPIVAAFAAQALAIAESYKSWGRVDDEWRWAPFLCRLPLPGVARPSESDDPTTHGQKLYSVFAKNHAAYPNGPHTDQAVVKESWVPELVTGPDASYSPGSYRPSVPDGGDASLSDVDDHFYGYAKGEGGVYRAASPAGLFIMFKVDAATSDTDLGWVYATVTTAGQVTSAGRVASCMGCHEVADHERLFGVPTSNF